MCNLFCFLFQRDSLVRGFPFRCNLFADYLWHLGVPIELQHTLNDIVVIGLSSFIPAHFTLLLIICDAQNVAFANLPDISPCNLHGQVSLAELQKLSHVFQVRRRQIESLRRRNLLLCEVPECVMRQNMHRIGHFSPHICLNKPPVDTHCSVLHLNQLFQLIYEALVLLLDLLYISLL